MIICTVILALLTVLIATEAEPQEPEPVPEQNPSPASAVIPERGQQRLDAAAYPSRSLNLGAGMPFVRQSRVFPTTLSLPLPRT